MRRFMLLPLIMLTLTTGTFALDESPTDHIRRQMLKHVTLEFADTPLVDACQLLSNIAGLNIIIANAVRTANPVVNLRVQDMDAGTCLNWLTKLTETHAEITDGAVFITDKPAQNDEDQERAGLMAMGAEKGLVIELPPQGQALTDQDRVKIALLLMEKEQMKIQDFPGPDVIGGLAGDQKK